MRAEDVLAAAIAKARRSLAAPKTKRHAERRVMRYTEFANAKGRSAGRAARVKIAQLEGVRNLAFAGALNSGGDVASADEAFGGRRKPLEAARRKALRASARRAGGKFDESKHPRSKGKFAHKPGGASGSHGAAGAADPKLKGKTTPALTPGPSVLRNVSMHQLRLIIDRAESGGYGARSSKVAAESKLKLADLEGAKSANFDRLNDILRPKRHPEAKGMHARGSLNAKPKRWKFKSIGQSAGDSAPLKRRTVRKAAHRLAKMLAAGAGRA